jgi:hypothetical protein
LAGLPWTTPFSLVQSSREVPLSFRVLPACSAAVTSRRQCRGSFHGVLFPATSSARGVHWSRVCLTRYVPLAGFRNLLAVFSSSNLVGLFHPTDAHGIPSSRAFSSPRAVSPHRRSMPSCRCFLPSTSPRFPGDGGAHTFVVLGSNGRDLRSASGLCSRAELVHDPADVTPRGQPMLSWTFSSLGFPFPRRWPDSRRASSRASASEPPREVVRPPALQSLLLRGSGFLSLESAFPFRGFSPPLLTPVRDRAFLGYPSGLNLRHRKPLPLFETPREPYRSLS